MAKMYPETLIPSKVKSSAEKRLYYLLKGNLPEEYTVLWSVPLTAGLRDGGRKTREIDFLVLHPQKGILNLEVKGGRISYDRNSRQWYSTDRFGVKNSINDPYEQAKECMNILIRQLKDEMHAPLNRTAQYTFAHGVVFPSAPLDEQLHTLPAYRYNALDYLDIEPHAIAASIEKLYALYTRKTDRPLGTSTIEEIIDNILPRSFFMRPPLNILLNEDDAQLEKLTEQQFVVLDTLSRHRRVAISGCAGSGKTFLAVEQARRLAVRGKKVLLTCFNRNLSNWLRKLFRHKAGTEAALANVDVATFHQLHYKLLRQAETRGFLSAQGKQQSATNPAPFLPDTASTPPPHKPFQDGYDERLVPVIPLLGVHYDAIIVDEGQDFDDKWWDLLEALLCSQEESLLYVFYDENQILQSNRRSPNYPVPPEHYSSLTFNCRTTQKIHQEVVKYFTVGDPPASKPECPQGQEIKRIAFESLEAEGGAKLAELLKCLVHTEQVPLADIVMLSPYGKDRSYFRDGLVLDGGIALKWDMDAPPKDNTLTCCSISAFKGLERKAVILVETDAIWNDKLWYVALSRARELLIIVERGGTGDPFLPDFPDDI